MIHVLGLSLGILTPTEAEQRILDEAAYVAGGKRVLALLGIPADSQIVLDGPVSEFAAKISTAANHGSVCVAADGDPLLFGIGASLLECFSPQELCFHPHVSAMQTAAARFGLPWHTTYIMSLHGRDNVTELFCALTHSRLIGVYTDARHSPDALARILLQRGVSGWEMLVAEALCLPEETCTRITLEDAVSRTWHALTLVFFVRSTTPRLALHPGLPDEALHHRKGLISKQAIRAMSLSLLRLSANCTLWDLGAGSGAVSLEAAALLTKGSIVAVERDSRRIEDIRANIAQTGAWLIETVHEDITTFLSATASDPARSRPDRIFLGGGASPSNLLAACNLLVAGGHLVISAVLFSTLTQSRQTLESLGWPVRVHQLMHHVSEPLGNDLRLVPDNPVFLLETQKPHPIHE